jgi:ABC-2 type transport system permease protein
MKATVVVLQALLRQTVRNRQGLFWTLFFPVFLMLVFSLFGNSGSRVTVAVVAPRGTASPVVRLLSASPLFSVRRLGARAALAAVRNGTIDAALLVPATRSDPTTLTLRYNNADTLVGSQAVGAIQAYVDRLDVVLSGRPPAFVVAARPVSGSRSFTYLDFLLPGVLALMAMQNSLFGIGAGLTRWKERGILRRFRVTPLRPAQFLGAAVLNYLVVGLITSGIVVAIGVGVLHASVAVPVAPLVLVLVLGMAGFLALGFLVAGVARTQDAVVPIINLISFPMMFLSGVFFPVSSLPRFLATVVGYFPLTFLADALRGLMTGGLTVAAPAFRTDLLGMGAWLVATGMAAARIWRWE